MRLQGKVALVTGGAMGQGEAIARLFSKEGAIVILADFSKRVKDVAKDINDQGGQAEFYHMDVSKSEDWIGLVKFIEDKYNTLNILINNAGIPGRKGIKELSEEEWQKIIDVDAKSVFLGMHYTLPLFEKNNGGSVVNISSIWGIVGSGASSAYHAAKGAVRMLSKTTAIELAPLGIRVNSILPGYISTPMVGTMNDDIKRNIISNVPLGRAGEPNEIAYAALFLASDESLFITGIDLPVDGGYTAK